MVAAAPQTQVEKMAVQWMSRSAGTLACKNNVKNVLRDKIMEALKPDVSIPAFSSSVKNLQEAIKQHEINPHLVSDAIKLDPGLASRFLHMANLQKKQLRNTSNIREALLRIGMADVRKSTTAIGVIDKVSHTRVRISWDVFHLHSILTARLTERLAEAYRPLNGNEYIAGLLHDSGKLFLEHYFPREFDDVIQRAMERQGGMYEAEKTLLGITHAEISSILCEKWGLHREIVRSVRFHHEPDSPFNKEVADLEGQRLLALCICVADFLANICKVNIQGAKDMGGMELEQIPEWILLQQFTPRLTLHIDLMDELEKARKSLLSGFARPTMVPPSAPAGPAVEAPVPTAIH